MTFLSIEESNKLLYDLADHLDTVPADEFDYTIFTTGPITPEHPCGTTACALGHAPAVPSIAARGFVVRAIPGNSASEGELVLMRNSTIVTRDIKDVARHVFTLSDELVNYLFWCDARLFTENHFTENHGWTPFSPDESAGPKDVAAHIRNVARMRAEGQLSEYEPENIG